MTTWCRVHNTNHAKTNYLKFVAAINIVQKQMQNYDIIPNNKPSTSASHNETLMFEVFTAIDNEEREDVPQQSECFDSKPMYVALDNSRRFGYTFRRQEPLIESTPPNSLQVPPDPNSSNNPPPPGPSTIARNTQPQSGRTAPRVDKAPVPPAREIEKGKGPSPLDDKTKSFSYNVLEVLGNIKSNLTYLETLEIDKVHQQLMGYILEVKERRAKAKSSRPPQATIVDASP